MYLGLTPALQELQARLGQGNRELATVLVGLEMVRAGEGILVAIPRLAWEDDADREQSVRHARRFVHDAALGRIVDALDEYLASVRREPAFAASAPEFAAAQERSVKSRLEALAKDLGVACTLELALAHLAIQWRNRRLHSGAGNRLEQRYVAVIRSGGTLSSSQSHGLDATRLLDHFASSRSPRVRELAVLTRATSATAALLDRALVIAATPTAVAEGILKGAIQEEGEPGKPILSELWSHPREKRRTKVQHLLRTRGFRDEPLAPDQTKLADEWLDDLVASGYREAAARFGLVEERSVMRDDDREAGAR